jgi:hypothetical protein
VLNSKGGEKKIRTGGPPPLCHQGATSSGVRGTGGGAWPSSISAPGPSLRRLCLHHHRDVASRGGSLWRGGAEAPTEESSSRPEGKRSWRQLAGGRAKRPVEEVGCRR